jgi:hypothetical protein
MLHATNVRLGIPRVIPEGIWALLKNLGVVIIDVNLDVEFSTSLSMVLELFGNTQG